MDIDDLKNALVYDKSTGNFFWNCSPSKSAKKDSRAGNVLNNGYVLICFRYKRYLAHRIAWMFEYGNFPEKEIDHINGIKSDNRICNLREATRSENMANVGPYPSNKSGYKGVCKRGNKWVATSSKDNKRIYLGTFDDIKDAANAYRKYTELNNGSFNKFQ